MNRSQRVFAFAVLISLWLLPAGLVWAEQGDTQQAQPKAADAAPAEKEAVPAKPAKPPKEFSPELAALRDRVRRVLAAHHNQTLNTHDNSATEIMDRCWAFGCNTEVLLEGPSGQTANGITCLCWNYPCAGFEMLTVCKDHVAARVGYGYQRHPGEFLAMLALSRVGDDYPIRVGEVKRKVADLVEAEKLSCRADSDMSLKLIGLALYVQEPEWKNDLGETWSLSRMIRDELAHPLGTTPEGSMNRLMGLSFAVARRAKTGQPINGQFQRAQAYVSEFHQYALRTQNADGSWGADLSNGKSTNADVANQLDATGRILEWLAMSLADKKLEEKSVQNAVEQVTGLLGGQRYFWNTHALSARELAAVAHALHALAVYDLRVFKPADVEKPADAEKPAVAEKPAQEKSPPATAERSDKPASPR